MLTDFNNFDKRKNFKIKKKHDENFNNLFLKIKVEKMKKFKSFAIKNFNINDTFNTYKKEIVFYEILNQILQKQLIS